MADYAVSQRDHDALRRLVQDQSRELKNLKNRLTEFGVRGHHGTQHLRLYQVKNNTGSERRRGDVVEVEGYLMELPDDHLDYLRLWQNGETPDETRHFGILDAVLPDGQKGAAFVHGVCFAYVNVIDEEHEYAKPRSDFHVLESATSGPVRILHKNTTGTGERECIVVFSGNTAATGEYATATLSEPMCGAESGEEVAIEDFQIQSSAAFAGEVPTTVFNWLQRQAPANYLVHIHHYLFDPVTGDEFDHWAVVAAHARREDHIFDMRIKSDKTAIEVRVYENAVLESCKEPIWKDKIPLEQCDPA